MCSRHKGRKKWQVFVLYDGAEEGLEQIVEWCCQCSSGLRTVCPCAHVIAVIAILGDGFEGSVPAERLANLVRQENEESSSSE